MSWLSELFRSRAQDTPRRRVDVGYVEATIVMDDGTAFERTFLGQDYGDPEWIVSAADRFEAWRGSGSTGTLAVGSGVYVPLCKVARIVVKHSKHEVEI